MNPLATSIQTIDIFVIALYGIVVLLTVPIWFRVNGLRPSVTFVLGITLIIGFGAVFGLYSDERIIYPIVRLLMLLWIVLYVIRLSRWEPSDYDNRDNNLK